MRIVYSWLREFAPTDLGAEELAELISSRGVKVEEVLRPWAGLEGVVVARVAEVADHPVSDKLCVAQVDDGTDVLTVGQYLRPTLNHLPVERFVTPAEFDRYRGAALALGFLECVSGPLVRSSYRAEQALNRNNAGLDNRSLGS